MRRTYTVTFSNGLPSATCRSWQTTYAHAQSVLRRLPEDGVIATVSNVSAWGVSLMAQFSRSLPGGPVERKDWTYDEEAAQ